MKTRTRTIASLFSVAMGAMLLGGVVSTQVQPQPALALGANPTAVAAPAPRPQGPLTLETFREIARLQTPGVVNISTRKTVRRSRGRQQGMQDLFGDDWMERFFGPQRRGGPGDRGRTQNSLGSGFVVDKEGYVLTNRHVVEGADGITVQIGRREYDAKLVGRDARTDVALLKIEPKEALTVLNLGNSDQTEVGEWVMAIGNPFGLGGSSVTVGVVSYKGRPLTLGSLGTTVDMIQTDAAINPGNSGGPLLNTRGEVIGINTLIVTQGLPQSAGVGFAVPINVAREILPQLRATGKVVRGWLGVAILGLTEDLALTYALEDPDGAVVNEVTPGSPAEKAGVQVDDVVVAVDGRKVVDNGDLSSYIASKAPGATVSLEVVRGGQKRTIPVTLGTFPEQADASEQEPEDRAELGMTLRDLTPDMAERLDLPRTTRGVIVWDVEPGEAAENAGLQRGDLITTVNGQDVQDVETFRRAIEAARPAGLARLRIRRGGQPTILVLRLR